MKKSIHTIAAEVLAEQNRPMTAEEIYEVIQERGLYEFKAQNPKSVLRNQLRRYSENVSGAHQAANTLFKMLDDGRFRLWENA